MKLLLQIKNWQEPEYGPRAEAVERTLAAPNAFTEEAVAFAINQRMDQLGAGGLEGLAVPAARPLRVGVFDRGDVPMQGLPDLLAVVLSGHAYRGVLSEASPYLLPAFVADVRRHDPAFDAAFVDAAFVDAAFVDAAFVDAAFVDVDALYGEVDAVVATGDAEELEGVAARCEAAGIPPERRLLRPRRHGMAVLDGRETEDELEHLAEDVLLHEGRSPRSVALVWVPRGHAPDALLDAFAAFRGVFPAHPSTPGALKMQQAFLKASGLPHAFGEGLEFLLSKGPPDVQRPGHVRWVDYDALDEVEGWLALHAPEVELVVARPHLAKRLGTTLPVLPPGRAHRPAAAEETATKELLAFLKTM